MKAILGPRDRNKHRWGLGLVAGQPNPNSPTSLKEKLTETWRQPPDLDTLSGSQAGVGRSVPLDYEDTDMCAANAACQRRHVGPGARNFPGRCFEAQCRRRAANPTPGAPFRASSTTLRRFSICPCFAQMSFLGRLADLILL